MNEHMVAFSCTVHVGTLASLITSTVIKNGVSTASATSAALWGIAVVNVLTQRPAGAELFG